MIQGTGREWPGREERLGREIEPRAPVLLILKGKLNVTDLDKNYT